MKKVKIPTCKRPFNVFVNGKKYTYHSGTEQEVPDEVAIVIEQHEAYHEEKDKIDKEGDGSQGGGTGGGGYSTCKVHVAFPTDYYGIGIFYCTLDGNGNPAKANMDNRGKYDDATGEYVPPTESEYDINVIYGSYITICDFDLSGISVESNLIKEYTGNGYCLFVPAGSTGSSIRISSGY